MNLFEFEIREVLSCRIIVQAESVNDAWDEVERMYMESEIVLDKNDFSERLVETQAMSKSRSEVSRCEHG